MKTRFMAIDAAKLDQKAERLAHQDYGGISGTVTMGGRSGINAVFAHYTGTFGRAGDASQVNRQLGVGDGNHGSRKR